MKSVGVVLLCLVSAALGFGGAFWLFRYGPWVEPEVEANLSQPPAQILLTDSVNLDVTLKPKASQPLLLQVEAKLLDTAEKCLDSRSKVVLFKPPEALEPLSFTFPSLPDAIGGIRHFRVSVTQLKKDGSKKLYFEGERAFVVSAPPPPPPPEPVPSPSPTPMPAVKKKVRKPLPKTPLPKKLGPPQIELELNQVGAVEFGKSLVFNLSISNKGESEAQVNVEFFGEPQSFFPKKTLGPFRLASGDQTNLKETYPLDTKLSEGPYSFKALVFLAGTEAVLSEKSVAVRVVDKPPSAEFEDPPIKLRVGQPVTFTVQASDDKAVDWAILHLRSLDNAMAPLMLSMTLAEGTKTKGMWSCKTEPLKTPGQYTFFAELEDDNGKKFQTEELKFIVGVR